MNKNISSQGIALISTRRRLIERYVNPWLKMLQNLDNVLYEDLLWQGLCFCALKHQDNELKEVCSVIKSFIYGPTAKS
jgi:hypothetical protein